MKIITDNGFLKFREESTGLTTSSRRRFIARSEIRGGKYIVASVKGIKEADWITRHVNIPDGYNYVALVFGETGLEVVGSTDYPHPSDLLNPSDAEFAIFQYLKKRGEIIYG